MSVPVVIVGAKINLYINNALYKETDSVSFSIETEINEITGIDSIYNQELAPNKVKVSGSVRGMRLRLSGGLQGKNIKPLFTDVAQSPYISILIEDRQTQENIFFCANAMVTRESHSIPAKGIYRLDFDFVGMVPLMALDRA
jgi:hypothetical protein